jgi:homoserine O-acetyltransferase/O-succinyltransferase
MTASSTVSTGAWRDGDSPGRRQFVALPRLVLERGGALPHGQLAYETWGRLNPERDNAVLVLHALSGDSHVAGDIEPGHSSLAPDGRPWGSRWPAITIRDQVAAEVPLANALGVWAWAAVVGGSMGGMRALEWALCQPHRVHRAIVLAVGAEATADQVATCRVQIDAIRADPRWHHGDYYDTPTSPVTGMAIARRIAHLTYRSAAEVDTRFGRTAMAGGDPLNEGFAVESWLEHAATSLQDRFDAGSYVALTAAMNSHEIGRGRGGTATALRQMRTRPTIVGVDSDRLSPLHQQAELADLLGVDLKVIHSQRGHDGFLVETDQVNAVLADVLT